MRESELHSAYRAAGETSFGLVCAPRRFVFCVTCAAAIALVLGQSIVALAGQAEAIEFNRHIRPILADKCFHCHGPDSATREADLRLDLEASAKADREGRSPIVPGKPAASELIRRITSHDPDERMPPKESRKTLTEDEVDLLRRWIADGARWSLPWAYVAPQRHMVPAVQQKSWPRNWIDYFVLAKLEKERLHPAADADRLTLIRRLSIDLTGLPPTPAEANRFLADTSPDAYERLVDRLLASPRFGERLAMYWLDLVRYADTTGYAGDQEQHITPYRDYVIGAFNRNLRFDQFTREQLAGDLLASPTVEQLVATGYNRLLQTSHEGGIQIKEYLAIYGADRVRNVSSVWMAATMGCAQCHDHKFDPFTIKDFYSLQAFFADIDETDHLRHGRDISPTTRAPEIVVYPADESAKLLALQSRLEELRERVEATGELVSKASGDPERADYPKAVGAAELVAQLQTQLDELKSRIRKIQDGGRRTMITAAVAPRTIRILPRGNWQDDSGQVVEPAVPEFLGKTSPHGRRANRLDLANWLVDADRGVGKLTARVTVNRLWYLLFGRGLAAALDDFGGRGELPDDAELLDNLAVEFVESGWNVKQLMKQIVMSRTYRQASSESPAARERDPQNRLLARQARHRYSAETVRDSVLAISGLLVEQVGGPSVRPYQPEGYYRHLNQPKREYHADSDSGQWRRGVYVHWQRQYLHPMLKAFDAPPRDECTAQRPRSNTPLTALVLLNDPTFVEAARALAERILADGGSTFEQRLEFAFRQAVLRVPHPDEQAQLAELLKAMRDEFAKTPKDADNLLSIGIARSPKHFDRTELAALTIVARAILSMSETLTRS